MPHRIVAAVRAAQTSLSFEFFPPRGVDGEGVLARSVGALGEVAPDFVSVTYGAGGSSAARAAASVHLTRLIARAGPAALAHLTVVGHTVAELGGIVRDLIEAGADAILALRGDPLGQSTGPWRPTPGGLLYAVDLVRLLADAGCDVGVAAFPRGHPAAASLAEDTRVLAMKEQAGAAFAITQMVFEAESYASLVARTRRAGVGLPIVPGIMPVSAASQVPRLETFSGAPLPAPLRETLAAARGDAMGEAEVGVAWAVALARDLLDCGAPGLHFYTLNRSGSSLEVCRRLALSGH
jgi:methylenetetrahydrofolate reductase (NADPH)